MAFNFFKNYISRRHNASCDMDSFYYNLPDVRRYMSDRLCLWPLKRVRPTCPLTHFRNDGGGDAEIARSNSSTIPGSFAPLAFTLKFWPVIANDDAGATDKRRRKEPPLEEPSAFWAVSAAANGGGITMSVCQSVAICSL